MTAEVPSQVPAELIAGDTWHFTRSFDDYLAPTWVATFYLEFTEGAFTKAATASGTDHDFAITATESADIKAGRYKWWIRAVSGSDAFTIEDGWLEVKPNPAATGKRDHRSDVRKTLDALNATLLGKATADQAAMTIGGRSISRIPLPEILEWRDKLRNEVKAEERGANPSRGRVIKARFVRA